MDEQQRKRIVSRGLMFLTATVMLGGAWYAGFIPTPGGFIPEETDLPPSEPIFTEPAPLPVPDAVITGSIDLDRRNIDIGDIIATIDRYSGSFTITARDTPVTIRSVTMPFSADVGVRIDATNCEGDGRLLREGESCIVNVIYDPSSPGRLDGRILISALSTSTDGRERDLSASIPITGYARAPDPVPYIPPPQTTNPVDLANLQAVALNRRAANLQAIQMTEAALLHAGPQRPVSEDWNDIGYGTNLSTFPVDMTRVLTMDKPIPAVIRYPIDTRNPTRAVASVERDIYGNDGRTVLIDRGSTLIGSVGAISSSGEEKVSISWERLVRPDGAAFSFQASSGDAMGRSGVVGHIDNRWPERFGTQLLATAFNVGVILGLDSDGQETTSAIGSVTSSRDARSQATEQFRSDMTALQRAFAREKMTLPPIRTVPVGTRITVWPTTDLWLRPIMPSRQMREQHMASVRRSPEYAAAMAAAGRQPDVPTPVPTPPTQGQNIVPVPVPSYPGAPNLIPPTPAPVPPQNWTQMPSASERLLQAQQASDLLGNQLLQSQQPQVSPWFQYNR